MSKAIFTTSSKGRAHFYQEGPEMIAPATPKLRGTSLTSEQLRQARANTDKNGYVLPEVLDELHFSGAKLHVREIEKAILQLL